ncbi:MAG: hypothetical protein NTZ65_01000 [Candidatus Berkelbacteria bacterium]|nr:hypothetical protein [Candidatus Berkelbacteria bacterium]
MNEEEKDKKAGEDKDEETKDVKDKDKGCDDCSKCCGCYSK